MSGTISAGWSSAGAYPWRRANTNMHGMSNRRTGGAPCWTFNVVNFAPLTIVSHTRPPLFSLFDPLSRAVRRPVGSTGLVQEA